MSKVQTQSEWEWQAANDIFKFIKNELYMELRFFDVAFCSLIPKIDETIDTMSTDGNFIYFKPEHMISVFKKNSKYLDRLYLHSILHCIYSHLWVRGERDLFLWGIACDIIVEYTIDKMENETLKRPLSWLRMQTYEKMNENKAGLSAAVIYRKLMKLDSETINRLAVEFYTDTHTHWPKENKMSAVQNQTKNKWDKISRQSEIKKESQGKDSEEEKNFWQQQIKAERGKKSYKDFLRKFCKLKEELRIDMDEYDLNYYTYGLRLYRNMPLIEPMETKENLRIEELVIVVDTSYSTKGELVKKFLRETFTILSETDSFFNKRKIHIIQCDEMVHSDIIITKDTDIDVLINNFELAGGGNTDFRPAFEYVNKLIDTGEIKKLQGLLYFTDGKGRYPKKKMPYQTAFVFIDKMSECEVPAWAMKVELE